MFGYIFKLLNNWRQKSMTERLSFGGLEFVVEDCISSNPFGSINSGKEVINNEDVVIKLELKRVYEPHLPLEYNFYIKLGDNKGIPKLYGFGEYGLSNALVIERLGPDLNFMFDKCGHNFTLKTVCQLALQVIDIFEYFHSKGLIYRDIKPENFMFGMTGSDKYNVLHIKDFSLCKEYIDEETNAHIPDAERKGMTGTVRYMSVNNNLGKEQSRRDDLESVGYLLIYLMKGSLPWQGINVPIEQRYRAIAKTKSQTTPQRLCDGLPQGFCEYITYTRNLGFTQQPDYQFLSQLFIKMLTKNGYKRDEVYDFDRNHRPINSI